MSLSLNLIIRPKLRIKKHDYNITYNKSDKAGSARFLKRFLKEGRRDKNDTWKTFSKGMIQSKLRKRAN